MALTVSRTGFGQVEPNHLSAQRTAQIYAQLPVIDSGDAKIDLLENGQFVKYDYATHTTTCPNGQVNLTGAGEWMLVFNEVKLYDGWRETYKDFAMQRANYVDKEMVPRVFKTNVGDIMTTNCVGAANTAKDAEYAGVSLSVGDYLAPAATGYLAKQASKPSTGMVWQVAAETTMADEQPAVKIVRIQ